LDGYFVYRTNYGSIQYHVLREPENKNNENLLFLENFNEQEDLEEEICTKKKERKLSVIRMILLNAVVCGVEICDCASFSYIPPMLLKAGYSEVPMTSVLAVGNVFCLFLIPVIGRASDRSRSACGRRRPFILVLSLVVLISMIIIPYHDSLSAGYTGSLILLGVGVILLDFSHQACLTPCEALLSDLTLNGDQQEQIFVVYSMMVSLGGIVGYLITALDWRATIVGDLIGGQDKFVFTTLAGIYLVLLVVTFAVARENRHTLDTIIHNPNTKRSSNGANSLGSLNRELQPKTYPKWSLNLQNFHTLLLLSKYYTRNATSKIINHLPEPIRNLLNVPYVVRKLIYPNFFGWAGVVGFNLYFTDFVGQAVYHGDPILPENNTLREHYDEGVRMGCWGLLLHCVVSILYACVIERLIEKIGVRMTYAVGMTSFSVAMIAMAVYPNIYFVTTMAALTGVAYGTLTTIPYILVTLYHSEKEVRYSEWNKY
jgi:solute carrier family 45 protein 3